ncbi:hypothetical protein M422DRAFT_274400 [Sphaerobolus stellatus SS14]|uniref:Uncharacterized protein n=1 Tax=Sphaerobolus stellatus (strain SS14) TaxID=990650 RepID=A0A0C9UHR6_SPHS4|nr:hypothetical protein M422DRAFT_274400 [Sphaerobolus stellatus SS14]
MSLQSSISIHNYIHANNVEMDQMLANSNLEALHQCMEQSSTSLFGGSQQSSLQLPALEQPAFQQTTLEEEPAAQLPVSALLASQLPIVGQLASQPPASGSPTSHMPTLGPPAARQPILGPPAAHLPTLDLPASQLPALDPPASQLPTVGPLSSSAQDPATPPITSSAPLPFTAWCLMLQQRILAAEEEAAEHNVQDFILITFLQCGDRLEVQSKLNVTAPLDPTIDHCLTLALSEPQSRLLALQVHDTLCHGDLLSPVLKCHAT